MKTCPPKGVRPKLQCLKSSFVLLGFGLDYLFNTTPIFLIIMIFFGFAAGVKTMMKTANEIKE